MKYYMMDVSNCNLSDYDNSSNYSQINHKTFLFLLHFFLDKWAD